MLLRNFESVGFFRPLVNVDSASDAIDHDIGLIQVVTGPSDRKGYTIFVDITDNGRGILFKKKSDVFRPGFSTKDIDTLSEHTSMVL